MKLAELIELKTTRAVSVQREKNLAQAEIEKLTAEFLANGGTVDVIGSTVTRNLSEIQMVASRQLYGMSEQGVINARKRKSRR